MNSFMEIVFILPRADEDRSNPGSTSVPSNN